MKVIDSQTAEILSLGEATLEEGKKIVEIAGRTCYKSLNLITEGSAEKFVNTTNGSADDSELDNDYIIDEGNGDFSFVTNPDIDKFYQANKVIIWLINKLKKCFS